MNIKLTIYLNEIKPKKNVTNIIRATDQIKTIEHLFMRELCLNSQQLYFVTILVVLCV